MTLLPPPSLLETRTADGMTVVHVNEVSLGEPNLRVIDEELTQLVDAAPEHRVYLDFAEVRYVSSLGLALVVRLHRKLKQAGGHLALLNVHPFVYEVFEVTHLTSFLDVRRPDQEVEAA